MNVLRSSLPAIVILMIVLSIVAVLLPIESQALTLFGEVIRDPRDNRTCEPHLPPTRGGCNIYHFISLIRVFISFLIKIAIPLAAVFVAWGGIIIMSAGGSTERVAQGKKIITAAIIGLVIILGAWLIVATIYVALPVAGVGERIKDVLFGNRI